MPRLRIASLNLRAYPNPERSQIDRLAAAVQDARPDIVLLQECLRPWLPKLCDATKLTGAHSHDLPPETPRRSFAPDGCAIAWRPEFTVLGKRRIAPDRFLAGSVADRLAEDPPSGFQPMPERLAYRYSGRSALVDLEVEGRCFTAASFHATPGTGTVGGVEVAEWKPFFHGAVAIELARIDQPFVFGIDANEPLAETGDSIRFHWDDERSGVRKLGALLGLEPIHRGRDLFRDWLKETDGAPLSEELLGETYAPSPTFQRRFDSLWATAEFELRDFSVVAEPIRKAGGDHAMLVSDLELTSEAPG